MNTRASVVPIEQFSDDRGTLSVGQTGGTLPFTPVRFFIISDVPPGATRGRHAHRQCHQFLIVVSGSCRLALTDQHGRDDLTLSSPATGIHIPPMTWGELSEFAPDTVVLVLASHPYDVGDYIRSLDELTGSGRVS